MTITCPRRRRLPVLALALVALVTASCGGGSSDSADTSTTKDRATTTDAPGPTTPPEPASAVVRRACDQTDAVRAAADGPDRADDDVYLDYVAKFIDLLGAGDDQELLELADGELRRVAEIAAAGVKNDRSDVIEVLDQVAARCELLDAPTAPDSKARQVLVELCLAELPPDGRATNDGDPEPDAVAAIANVVTVMRSKAPGSDDEFIVDAVDEIAQAFDADPPVGPAIETQLGNSYNPLSFQTGLDAFAARCTAVQSLTSLSVG